MNQDSGLPESVLHEVGERIEGSAADAGRRKSLRIALGKAIVFGFGPGDGLRKISGAGANCCNREFQIKGSNLRLIKFSGLTRVECRGGQTLHNTGDHLTRGFCFARNAHKDWLVNSFVPRQILAVSLAAFRAVEGLRGMRFGALCADDEVETALLAFCFELRVTISHAE
jgi:hypothetical protein